MAIQHLVRSLLLINLMYIIYIMAQNKRRIRLFIACLFYRWDIML